MLKFPSKLWVDGYDDHEYIPKKGVQSSVYMWLYIIWDSTIFWRQNIQTLLAESMYNPKSAGACIHIDII